MSLKDRVGRLVADTFFAINADLASRKSISDYCNATDARPRRWAAGMLADGAPKPYTDWPGLTDLATAGRHLPPWSEDDAEDPYRGRPAEPAFEDLAKLFARPKNELMKINRSSLLFMSVAQWFTDSFLRSDDQRRGWTDSNHEIDLCALYGLTEEKTRMLRRVENGALTHELDYEVAPNGEHFPPRLLDVSADGSWALKRRYRAVPPGPELDANGDVIPPEPHGSSVDLHDHAKLQRILKLVQKDRLADIRAMGLEHGNVTIGYLAVNTLFLRAHNVVANAIKADNPTWDDERVFQTARLVMVVILIKVVIEDYVAHIAHQPFKMPIGMADKARWGKPNRIAVEFNLLYRWHPMVPDVIEVGGKGYGPGSYMHNPALLVEHGLGAVVDALSKQPAGRLSLRNHPEFMVPTLANSFAMSRAHRLQGYCAYCRQFGLTPPKDFEELVGEQEGAEELVAELKALYGTVEKLEWFTGLFAERQAGRTIMGDLLLTMVANDAFTQALNNPLLSAAVYHPNSERADFREDVFSPTGKKIIDKVSTVADLLKLVHPEDADGIRCTMFHKYAKK